MLDLDKLNTSKTYVGWQIGDGFISKVIQKLSAKETDLPKKQIASHIFMLMHENGWQVVEAHAKWKGVKKLPFDEWKVDYKLENVFCAECALNLVQVKYFIDFNPGYSIAQVSKDAVNEITDKHLWNDSPGVVCSELFACCEQNFSTCYLYNLPTYQIKPVHVQMEYFNKDTALVS